MTPRQFQKIIWNYYERSGRRGLLWRAPAHVKNPYRIVVSEIMLQQTQVTRVEKKYPKFIRRFPSFRALAGASVEDVLRAWQGLGYNRRALNLKRIAEIVTKEHAGKLPDDPRVLETLSGIGAGTAGSIAAFAYNKPSVFIETNIRRVFLHHFFKDRSNVRDAEILPYIARTLDTKNPREWYYALMDYGSQLIPLTGVNVNTRSRTYRKQPAFKGSKRAVRGAILRMLIEKKRAKFEELATHLGSTTQYINDVVGELEAEGFVTVRGKYVKIA